VNQPPPFGDPDYTYGQFVPPPGQYPPPAQSPPPAQYPPPGQYPPAQYPPGQYPPPVPYPPGPYPPMGPAWGPPPVDVHAPQPGVIPLRRSGLDSGDIVSGVITAFRRDWRALLGVSAITNGIQYVLMIATLIVAIIAALPGLRKLADLPDNPSNEQLRPIVPGLLVILFVALGVVLLISACSRILLNALVAVIVGEDSVGRQIGVAEALAMIRPVLGRLLLQGILGGLGLAVGFVLCIIPGLWLFGIWGVATPVLALERTGVGGSFGRSRKLVQGMFWRVFGIRLLAFFAAGVCSYLLSLPFNITSSIGNQPSASTLIIVLCLAALGQFLISMLTAPITAIVDTQLYLDLRIRKEQLAEQLRAGVPPRQF
jgi:hypothetical protein